MFKNEIFPSDDLNIKAYRNIKKSGIHTVVARPERFPYNDVAKWCFSYLQKDTGLILNASGLTITSLKEDGIRARYQPPESIVAMNDSFLKQFRVNHGKFETLMEDWFYDKEWSVKNSERYVPSRYLKSPYRVLNTMIYQLYDMKSSIHFRMKLFPMAYRIAQNGQVFN